MVFAYVASWTLALLILQSVLSHYAHSDNTNIGGTSWDQYLYTLKWFRQFTKRYITVYIDSNLPHLVTEESCSSNMAPVSATFSLTTISPPPGDKPLTQWRRKTTRWSAMKCQCTDFKGMLSQEMYVQFRIIKNDEQLTVQSSITTH